MGDRSQIAIKEYGEKAKVFLYGHWMGDPRPILQEALKKNQRWDDNEYLARIIFDVMTEGMHGEETGFGIGTRKHGDIEHPIPVLDCEKQTITWIKGEYSDEIPEKCTFEEFCGLDFSHID